MMTITVLIIILTCIVSYYGFNDRRILDRYKHYPYEEIRHKSYYRLLTAAFLHGSWTHLLINMFVLYQFGEYVEKQFRQFMGISGSIIFLVFYVLMAIGANIPTMIRQSNNRGFASIGASGAVSGILFMFILINPWSMLLIFFIIPCPAIVAGILYLIYSSWASKNSRDGIDHSAHFYGAIMGVLLFILVRPQIISEFINRLLNGPL